MPSGDPYTVFVTGANFISTVDVSLSAIETGDATNTAVDLDGEDGGGTTVIVANADISSDGAFRQEVTIPAQAEAIKFTIIATQVGSDTVTAEFAVNTAPTITALNEEHLTEGDSATMVTVFASDEDQDELNYLAVSSDPDVATVTVSDNILTVTPVAVGSAGNYGDCV